MRQVFIIVAIMFFSACTGKKDPNLLLYYNKPADKWTEALPVGNGRLGAMVFGGVEREQIQFNEETLWTGAPHDYSHKGASDYLDDIRQLLFVGKQKEAEQLAMKEFMSMPLKQTEYQPFGDLYIDFPGHEKYSNYHRELDISDAVCYTSYNVDGVNYRREVIASNPDQVIAIHLTADKAKALVFKVYLDSEHEKKSVATSNNTQILNVAVKDGVLKGVAKIKIDTDGEMATEKNEISVSGARSATIWLSANTNFKNYKDVSKDPMAALKTTFEGIKGLSFNEVKKKHINDYQSLFNRFTIDLGTSARDTLPTNIRLQKFTDSPDDPQLIGLYTQYGRYLLISSSRSGTQPANLQGIWNIDLAPAWGSKYTVNINTEMNYWPAEVTNLSECAEPLFGLMQDCSETGSVVAKEHYNLDGWVLHHNTDIWRGAAPINNSNHGIWVGGSGWLASHLWEHYLFTQDVDFLRNRAWPLMKGAALFYSEFLTVDPESGWLISTPSNSPENGGLVAGPTMDHQIIRSLFKACIQASEILNTDHEFAETLKEKVVKIAPNKIGQYGQLQEWMKDIDDPDNKHRHVSHLWGLYPSNDINWESTPELMKAAKQSLLFRGDEATGWSLAWKINFWARLRDGDHAYELIKLLFRPVGTNDTRYERGGGSYPNLFDAHPPFQIDGNFGAPAGIIEMLIQSHLSAIDILPALPTSLPDGKISGVCARGGFELSFIWKDRKLIDVEVLSKTGNPCRLRYNGKTVEFDTTKGKTYKLNGELKQI
ncbi:MAG TPA: glycoside hydrolase family 95 protein [Bacteroidales bacterium]|nr:glycoside hydrolase family 95 protein [Bacteroidales bacterium]